MKSLICKIGKVETHIEYGLRDLKGNSKPYFSVTSVVYEQSRNGRWVEAGGGANHEHILKVAPHLAPLIELHLADIDGVPLYAVENGFYHYENSDMEVVRKYLRLTATEAATLETTLNGLDDRLERKVAFSEFCEALKPRWKAEAIMAINTFELA